MGKDYLLDLAKKIEKVSIESANDYAKNIDKMVALINEAMLERPNIKDLVGENIEMMKDNHANHARFISSILKNYQPEVFLDTVLWVFRAYRTHGFTTNYWAAQLNTWINIIEKALTPNAFKEIYPYYEWMQVNVPLFVKASDEKIENQNLQH